MNKSKLARVLREQARQIIDGDLDDVSSMDMAELISVLARILEGRPVELAFGSPGDWGYETEIGQALAAEDARATTAQVTGSVTPPRGRDLEDGEATDECTSCGWRGMRTGMKRLPGENGYAISLACPACGHVRFARLADGFDDDPDREQQQATAMLDGIVRGLDNAGQEG